MPFAISPQSALAPVACPGSSFAHYDPASGHSPGRNPTRAPVVGASLWTRFAKTCHADASLSRRVEHRDVRVLFADGASTAIHVRPFREDRHLQIRKASESARDLVDRDDPATGRLHGRRPGGRPHRRRDLGGNRETLSLVHRPTALLTRSASATRQRASFGAPPQWPDTSAVRSPHRPIDARAISSHRAAASAGAHAISSARP